MQIKVNCLIILFSVNLVFLPLSAISNEKGKLLFKENCASCHEFGRVLTGPDLTDVTSKRTFDWIFSFIKNSDSMIQAGDFEAIRIFNEYKQVKMPPSSLSDSEIVILIQFIESYIPPKYTAQSGKSYYNTSERSGIPFKVLITAFLIMALISVYLLTYKSNIKLRSLIFIRNIIHPVLYLLFLLIIAVFFSSYTYNYLNKRIKDYRIDNQEFSVRFSHQQHSGTFGINCIYCHLNATTNQKANIPSAQHCMKCHHYIRKGENGDTSEIYKLVKIAEKGQKLKIKKAIVYKIMYILITACISMLLG